MLNVGIYFFGFRFAMGFSRVSIRDTSPGFHVPFDLSQSSCVSQQVQNVAVKYATESEDIEECEKRDTIKDECKETDQTDTDFGEEFDLELLEEISNKESVVAEKKMSADVVRDQVVQQGKTEESRKEYDDLTKENTTTDDVESDGPSTGNVMADNAKTEVKTKKMKTSYVKRLKTKAKPKAALKTKMFSKHLKSKGRVQGCKSALRINIGFRAKVDGHKGREVDKGTPTLGHGVRFEVGLSDFCPLKSSTKAQYYREVSPSDRKRKRKESEQLVRY